LTLEGAAAVADCPGPSSAAALAPTSGGGGSWGPGGCAARAAAGRRAAVTAASGQGWIQPGVHTQAAAVLAVPATAAAVETVIAPAAVPAAAPSAAAGAATGGKPSTATKATKVIKGAAKATPAAPRARMQTAPKQKEAATLKFQNERARDEGSDSEEEGLAARSKWRRPVAQADRAARGARR
jgi:hypothetical protein